MSHRLSRRWNNATGQCPVVCPSHVDNDGTVARGVSTSRCPIVYPVVPSLFKPIEWAILGMAGWPVTGRRRGAFSTLLRRPGLRASMVAYWRSGDITRTQNVSEYMLVLPGSNCKRRRHEKRQYSIWQVQQETTPVFLLSAEYF